MQLPQFTISAKRSRTSSSAWTVTSATSCTSLVEALLSDAANALSIATSARTGVMAPLATSDRSTAYCRVSAAAATAGREGYGA